MDFAVAVIRLAQRLPTDDAGHLVRLQILRSGTAPAPNYGEAQSAESRSDFIHKVKIALKELRETRVWLRICLKAGLLPPEGLGPLLAECNELIAIFIQSVNTARENDRRSRPARKPPHHGSRANTEPGTDRTDKT